jgi:hypothetical protein
MFGSLSMRLSLDASHPHRHISPTKRTAFAASRFILPPHFAFNMGSRDFKAARNKIAKVWIPPLLRRGNGPPEKVIPRDAVE